MTRDEAFFWRAMLGRATDGPTGLLADQVVPDRSTRQQRRHAERQARKRPEKMAK